MTDKRQSKPGRGGKREGAGPKFSDPANPLENRLTITVSAALLRRLDNVLGGRNRSEFTRQCLLAGIEQEEFRQSKGPGV